MAGNYKIKIEPILNTASLNKQLNETKQLKLNTAGQTAGSSFVSGFGKAVKERFKYSIANALIYGTQNAVKDMVANVRELDKAQTELKKVTDLSGKSLEKFTDQAYEVGNKVAKTGTEIVQASTEFAKMGKDNKTSLQLSELASRFQNIADTEIDAATAAKFINSQLKAFGNTQTLQKFTGDFEKAERIIDVTNDTANKFAVGTNDLQNALTKTGSALSVAGNSFEQTIGLVTAGTEIMVGQPAKVGRGLRSIAINIANLARENEYFEAANGKVKVALQDSNGEMRSTYDIMADLGDVWGSLNETEQTAIATALAGKTQFEVFANVMKNWGTAAKVVDNAAKANGSSLRENERYLDSIEGKLANFQSAWEQLSYHVVNSDFLKGVIDLGTELIKVLDTLVQKFGTLPTLLGAAATAFGAWKLAEQTSKLLGFAGAAEKVAENVAEAGTAASVASSANGLGGLAKIIGILSNPAVIGGVAALAVAIGAIAIDKYFSFDSSLKRLNEYQDKLQEVTGEIEALKQKRDSDDGLTNAEKTHLAVLEAEERSLERQIKLEQQRVQNAFKEDISSNQGKKYQERTGPTQLLDYQDSRTKEANLDKQIQQQKELVKYAEQMAQYYRMMNDERGEELWEAQADAYIKQLDSMYDKYVKLDAEAAEAASNLAQYWEEVVNNVDYDSLDDNGKEAFDNIHKAFLESQIDASNLKDSFEDVSNVLNHAMDSLGHEHLDLFDNIDISSIETVEDAVSAIKKQLESLDGDTEISFQVNADDGSIETVTKKVSELTDKDIQAIISFNQNGLENIEGEANNTARDRTSNVDVTDNGTAGKTSNEIDDASKNRTTTISVIQKGANAVKSLLDRLTRPRSTTVTVNEQRGTTLRAKGKRRGEQGGLAWLGDEGSRTSPKPELVVSDDGRAYLAGTSGWEMYPVKDSDTVYSYAQTKKLLNGRQSFIGQVGRIPRYKKGKKSTKEKKREEFDKKLEKLEHKRKVNHWTDKKFRKEYKKLYNKYKKWLSRDQKYAYSEQREDYENERDTDKFKNKAENITTKKGLDNYIASVRKNKNLSSTEKKELIQDARHEYWSNKFKNDADNIVTKADLKNYIASVKKKTKSLSKQERNELIQSARHDFYSKQLGEEGKNILTSDDLANYIASVKSNKYLSKQEKADLIQDAGSSYYKSDFDRRVGILSARGDNPSVQGADLHSLINDIEKNQYLTKAEKFEYAKKAYLNVAKYNLKAYEDGVKTREETLQSIQAYYEKAGEYDEEYYEMLDELREADKAKEIERLRELQEQRENRLSLAQKYVQRELNQVKKQIDAEKEEADQLERLVELEKELTKAKATKIKVYREGKGFVYEQDTQAIEKAQKALTDYEKSIKKSSLEEYAEQLQAVLDLFSEMANDADIKQLEVLLGLSSANGLNNQISQLTGGNFGTNLSMWLPWIAQQNAEALGYANLADDLSKIATSQILDWLTDGETQVDAGRINEYLNKYSYASGTLSAPGGLSRVAERFGGELVWLGKGDSVYSNAISRNLMEWGRYNPAQVIHSSQSSGGQVFNFDQIVLPNVYNANDFYRELQNLPNKALQQSARRA